MLFLHRWRTVAEHLFRLTALMQLLHRGTLLQLKYFSDIPQTSGQTPDVQLHARDATLCIIRHLAPNLGECPDVFLLLQVKYFSDILWTSGQTPDV